jgi:HEPN domain-containing protein
MAKRHVIASTGKGVWSSHAKRLRNSAVLKYATEFHKVARKTRHPIIQAFLVGQALELYLKAFLLHRGMGESTLRNRPYGHNLARLLDEATARDISTNVRISVQQRSDVNLLSTVYSSKALQYFSVVYIIASPRLPRLVRIFRLADSLQKYLLTEIGGLP